MKCFVFSNKNIIFDITKKNIGNENNTTILITQTMDTKKFDYSKNAVLKKNVKNWYQLHHVDKLSNHINSDLTFQDVANCLLFGCDVYNCIGICDSRIREIIFSELSEILDKDYDFVYNLWLNSENK